MADLPIGANRLLARLPKEEYRRLAALVVPVSLDFKEVLYEAHGTIEHLYFPVRGVLSALHVMENGSAIEVATFGNEGAAGVAAFFGIETSLNRVIVQVAGDAVRVDARRLRGEAPPDSPLGKLLIRYYTAFLGQVLQSVACNGLHTIEKRCCRWLLMTRDRIGSDEIPLTHEFLAVMLGVRRPGVSEVLRSLKERRLLNYNRGTVTLLDRKKLEEACCECYRRSREEYERLLGRGA